MIGNVANSDNTRRWPRLPVDMPVRVVTSKGFSTTVVEGRGTEMSEGGIQGGHGDLLALAENERAVLVSGDQHLLKLGDDLPIQTARTFLDRLASA